MPLNERGVAITALETVWRELAPNVDKARILKERAAKQPAMYNDIEYKVNVRWLDAFEKYLAAVQAIYEATQYRGWFGIRINVPIDQIRDARQTGEKLLQILETGRERGRAAEQSRQGEARGGIGAA